MHSQFIAVLEKKQELIEVIVYCLRKRTPDIYDQLKRSTLVTIHIVNDIVSKLKQKDPRIIKEYKAQHQKLAFDLKTFITVPAHKNNHRSLITRYQPKKSLSVFVKRSAPIMRSRNRISLKLLTI